MQDWMLTDDEIIERYGDPADPNYGMPAYAKMIRFEREVTEYIENNAADAEMLAGEHFDRSVPGQPTHKTFEKFVGCYGRYTVAETPTDVLEARRQDIIRAAAARRVRGAVPDSSYIAAIRAIDSALAER